MKKNRRQAFLSLFLLFFGIGQVLGQTLACNNLVNLALDENGVYDIYPEDILEGGPYDYDNMQVFNWLTGEGGDFLTVDCDDIGSFTIQVVDTTTGIMCWGTCAVEDKLKPVPYAQNITVSLFGGSSMTVSASEVDAGSYDNCSIETMSISPSTFTDAGTYPITYTITDPSGNSDFALTNIIVEEGTPTCLDLVNVPIYFTGQAELTADVFIEGNATYDVLEISLDNVNFGESVFFNCDDAGENHTIYVHFEQDGDDFYCTSIASIFETTPIAVAKQNVVIGITSSGTAKFYAESLDNGSYDACTAIKLEIRRDEDICDLPGNTTYNADGHPNDGSSNPNSPNYDSDDGAFVRFCCEDVNNAIVDIDGDGVLDAGYVKVWLRVWDDEDGDAVFGSDGDNYQEVWSFVKVVDNFDPSIVCPADITITCDMDNSDLSLVGEANGYGICGDVEVEYTDIIVNLNACGEGFLRRRWNITGRSDIFCDQTISVEAIEDISVNVSFSEVGDFQVLGCPEEIDLGEPTWIGSPCDVIGYTVETDTFLFEDGACMKLVNHWYVISWCHYEPNNPQWDGSGIWEHTQVIIILGCTLDDVIYPDDIEISDVNGTLDNLSIENLQSIYGYTYHEVHPYTAVDCGGISYSHSDSEIMTSYGWKVIRTWTAVDWDSGETTIYNQLLNLNTNNNNALACNNLEIVTLENGPVTIWPSDVLEGGPYDYDNFTLSIVDENDDIVVDNLITETYVGQTLFYTVTDNTTNNSCWGELYIQDISIGDELTFVVPSVDVDEGISICLPLTVYNFNDIQTGAGTILWDSDVISYTGLVNPNLSGITGSLNETNTENGELKFIWSNPDPANPVSIPDGGSIFEICFDVVGVLGEESPVVLSTVGSLGFEWSTDLNTLPQMLVNGLVSITGMSCPLEEEDINYPLPNIYLPEYNLDPEVLTPQYLIDNYNFQESDVLITWPDDNCLLVGLSIENDVFEYGDGSFKIVRTITATDWVTYDPPSTEGIWTYTQVINTGIDPASLICDTLPRTADVGDCESGHTLDDDVEWPGHLEIADYRISPSEMVEFSMVDVLDSEPSFYNNVDDYEATYLDLLVELNASSVVIGRVWTVNHVLYGFTWTFNQSITVDFTDFENLVNINTSSNRAMPGVIINDAISTDTQGDAYVIGQPVDNIKYEDEYLNGINVLDLVLIQRHILDLNSLTDYALLAADINGNEAITSSDLIEFRKYIIGVIEQDKGDWNFYNKEIEGPITVEPKGVYVGVKTGDVDDSALLQGEAPLVPVSKFTVNDVLLNKGEIYSIPVYLNDVYDVFGVEFRAILDTDLIEVRKITSEHDLNDFEPHIRENGILTYIFSALEPITNIGGESSDPIFTIEIEAKENSLLSLALDLESQLSYLASTSLDLIVLGGEIGDMIGTGINSEELSNLLVYPNPTSDYLNIDLKNVNVRGDIEVSVYEMNGQKLLTTFNEKRIDVLDLNPGMYYYQVKIDTYTTTGKFMVIR